MRSLIFAAALALITPPAEAQDAVATAPDRTYGGVTPGGPTAATSRHPARGRVVRWPGFQPRDDGSSRVFVQTSASVRPSRIRCAEKRCEILLSDVVVPRGNARRSLDTRFFRTPVTRAWVQTRRHDAVLVLELRRDVQPVIREESAPDGTFFTFVEFEPPSGD